MDGLVKITTLHQLEPTYRKSQFYYHPDFTESFFLLNVYYVQFSAYSMYLTHLNTLIMYYSYVNDRITGRKMSET